MAIYPDTIKQLLEACELYTQNVLDIESLKARIWSAGRDIVAVEEKDLRQLLMRSEAELDSIQFTTDDNKIFANSLEVVNPLINALRANLAG